MGIEKILKRRRGFEDMTKEKRCEIAAMGGKAVHRLGKAHVWTSERAREAGRKGGNTPKKKRVKWVPAED